MAVNIDRSALRDMRFTYFIYGAFFLFNPFITVVDALPDFIGALFFILALYKIRDLSDHLESARTNLIRFFWVSLSRIPAFFIMFWISHNYSAERSIMLVFTFCYAVAETILLAFIFNSLFNGLIYLGERNEGTAVFRTIPTKKINGEYVFKAPKPQKAGKKKAKRPPHELTVAGVKRLSVITFLLLRALSVLPELVYITDKGDVLSGAQKVAPVHFKGIFTALAFIPALLLGIVWLVKFLKYIRGICADKQFCENVSVSYYKKVPAESMLPAYRRYSVFCILAGFASIFAVDFFLNDKNAIPDVIASALLFAALMYFSAKVSSVQPFAKLLCAAAVVLDLGSIILFERFSDSFIFSDVWRLPEATSSYLTFLLCDTAATALLLITAITLASTAVKHTKKELLADEIGKNSPRIRNEIADINRRKVLCFIAAIASACSNVFYRLTLVDTEYVSVADQEFTETTHLYIPRFETYWMIDVVIGLLLIAAAYSLIEKTKDSLKYKYMIED
ncbi:MAG: hypothetical protein IJN63_07120 [Clostridia bacterium]|nr:hypothetical protein [Clostridia bacterium]